jgi:hypothetical protein
MPVHLSREIENLKKEILTLGAMAEEAVHQATSALENRDEPLAQRSIKGCEPVQLAAFWLEALWMAWSPPKARCLRQPSQKERRYLGM